MSKWREVQLGSITTWTSGGTPKKSVSEFWDGTIPWISAKTLVDGWIKDSSLKISEAGLVDGSRIAIENSVLLLVRGSGLFNKRYIGIVKTPVAFNQDIKCIQANNEILPLYLYYWLKGNDAKLLELLEFTGIGAGKFDMSRLQALPVKLPPLPTQQKIAKILSSLDDKIELNNRMNENLEAQAFAMFDELLVSGTSTFCTLSELAELNPKRPLSKGTVAKCIDMAKLSTTTSFPSGWEDKPYTGGLRFSNGDTLFARITPCLENGKTAYINFLSDGEVAFGSTEYIVLSSKGDLPSEFFYCLARNQDFIDYATKNMNGSSGRQRVSSDTIGQYELPMLTSDSMEQFSNAVPKFFEQICNNSLENIRLAQLRDTLLPQLMSGEIDVDGVE